MATEENVPTDLKTTATLATDADELGLAEIGHKQQLKRQYGLWSVIALGIIATNTWSGLGGSLITGIFSGGPVVIIYGFLLTTVTNLFLVLSLAELVSSYPTAGGAYHWAAVIAPPKWGPLASFLTGYVNLFAWVFGTAASVLVLAQFVIAMANLVNPNFIIERWMIFVCYQFINLLSTIYSIFGNSLMPYVIRFALFWSMTACFITIIVMLAISNPKQSAHQVFQVFDNLTGWANNAIAVMVGLLAPTFGYAAIDATIHYAEEVQDPERNIPRSLLAVQGVGFVTGLGFLLALFFSVPNINDTFDTTTGLPIVQMYYQACGLKGGLALTIFLFFATIPALLDCQVATSRLLWAFARDDALPFSHFLKKVDKTSEIPIPACLATGISLALLGCIYIGNTTAFNAFMSSGVVLNNITFVVPIIINMLQGRKTFRRGKFTLHGITGWIVNVLTCIWVLFTVIFFDFPSFYPVTPANMNYTSLILGACLISGSLFWIITGYKKYRGPTIDALLETIDGQEYIREAPEGLGLEELNTGGKSNTNDRVG